VFNTGGMPNMPRVCRPASGVLGKHRKPTSASQQRCCRSNIE
jgi:hypothetical protein